jgi:hypothetical protein
MRPQGNDCIHKIVFPSENVDGFAKIPAPIPVITSSAPALKEVAGENTRLSIRVPQYFFLQLDFN